ncbi:uncharacterized protein LOC132198883 isoform X3 [Neocloeon triangulifer]|uniref:uncharacterized protein LOC132198883 isoform X3 n=1 Tax=Neocloeon triangulifer TaxID=2078957 RepID=UPI00286F9D0F|nr:uncharacterized protein LOC132198883 isoform X3 [Neocloeon triangulifer]
MLAQSEDSKKQWQRGSSFPRRRKTTYVAAFLFSMAYLCLLIFAPVFRGRKSFPNSVSWQQQLKAKELLDLGRHDASGRFRIVPFVLAGSRWSSLSANASSVLCVATQITLGQSDLLLPFVETAPGAVSVALFLPRQEIVAALTLLKFLRSCNAALHHRASVHLVVPHDSGIMQSPVDEGNSVDCGQKASEILRIITAGRELAKLEGPPAGLLRNVALEHCHNEWRASIEPQMQFPRGKTADLARNLNGFLAARSASERVAFVLPEFVLVKGAMPENRAELLSHALDGKVQPRGDYPNAYLPSELERWRSFGAPSNLVAAAYKVDKLNFGYQPAFLSRWKTPRFDERYAGEALVKFSQVYEMLMQGYQFYVLDTMYLCGNSSGMASAIPLGSDMHIFHESHLPDLISRYKKDPHQLLKHEHSSHNVPDQAK